MPKYLVVEIQKFANGSMSTPSWAYDSLLSAEAKYHTVLAAAAASSLPVHACILMSEEAFPIRHECYKHDPVEAEE